MKKILASILMASALLLTSCGDSTDTSGNETKSDTTSKADLNAKGNSVNIELKENDIIATLTVKDYGVIKFVLFPEVAPIGVNNFVKLANDGYYTDKSIHRVMSEFMIQGGSLNGDGTGGMAHDGSTFGVEAHPNAVHVYGALSYANAGGRNTCQFYIVNNKTPIKEDTFAQYENYYKGSKKWSDDIKKLYAEKGGVPFLDGDYTVFGQTIEGFDVLDAISNSEVQKNNRGELSEPVKDIIIESVVISSHK